MKGVVEGPSALAGREPPYSWDLSVDSEAPVQTTSVRQAGWWAGKGAWAVLDQGLFAVSNFIVMVMLARWLPPEQFGSFAVAHAVLLLAGTLHAGLLVEPMLVFGSARHATRFRSYLDHVLRAHWWLGGTLGIVLGGAAAALWSTGSVTLAAALAGAAVGTPLLLFAWLLRRACFSCMQPQWAAAGSAVYLILLLGGAILLRSAGRLSAASALILMGAGGLLTGLWILRLLRHRLPQAPGAGGALSTREVIRDHWSYGRWAIASSGLSWIPGNVYALALPVFAGLEAAGAFKALATLVLPIMHANTALATLLIPALASERDTPAFMALVRRALAAFAAASLAYWLVLSVFRVPIVSVLYAGAYGETSSLVPVVALLPFTGAAMAVLGSALRVLERPAQVFRAYVLSAAFALLAGVPLVAIAGLTGAAVALVLSSAVTAAASCVFLIKSRARVAPCA